MSLVRSLKPRESLRIGNHRIINIERRKIRLAVEISDGDKEFYDAVAKIRPPTDPRLMTYYRPNEPFPRKDVTHLDSEGKIVAAKNLQQKAG